MKIKEVLSKSNKPEMLSIMETSPKYFNDAIKLAVSDEQPYAWRAAWLLTHFVKQNDLRIKDYTKNLIDAVNDKKDGHQRELIKIILQMDLTEEDEGIFFNTCMNIWENVNKSSSVRIVAFKFISKIAQKYPELSEEITSITQAHYLKSLSPGIRKSVYKIIEKYKFH